MRIPLHIKTTVLASIVIILVEAFTISIFGSIMVDRLQKEQREFAEGQAEYLAERIAEIVPIDDYEGLSRLVTIFHDARIRKNTGDLIRIWTIEGPTFLKRVDTGSPLMLAELTGDAKSALLNRKEVKIENSDSARKMYQVFVPIVSRGRVIGVVEFAEELDTFSSLANRYFFLGLGITVSFIAITAFVLYLLTRYFVYLPLFELSSVMNRAKVGELEVRAETSDRDEFGRLGLELNRMLAEIEELSNESEKQKDVLESKVKDATAQLELRNEQLIHANAEIWGATSRLSQIEKLAAAGQTAAQFAHEVGTPLNLISGHIQLLRQQTDRPEAATKRLEIIADQIERIEGIVHSMLDKTRFGEAPIEAIDVNSVLKSVIEIVAPKLDAAGIRYDLESSDELPLIDANSERLQQVFFNLINNAVDAMPGGGYLQISANLADGEVVVQIKDDGIGMDEETRKRIFEPLFTTKERGQGTGLGLVVVKQILSESNARIAVKSEKGTGSEFQISFQAAKGRNS